MKPTLSPKAFLLQLVRDESADMSLRVEAAAALLPYCSLPATAAKPKRKRTTKPKLAVVRAIRQE